MNRPRGKHVIGGLFAFTLIGVFALLSLLLVVIGTQAYRSVVARSDANAQARTAVNYILNRAHSADTSGGVRVEGDAICMPALLGEEELEICVYLHDGYLMEQLVGAGEPLQKEYGERLVEAEGLQLRDEEGRIYVSVTTASGETYGTYIATRSAR